ncbi:MAG: carboxypeptidase-like regulatory domain-containing protein, partial [Bacteroidaceae bacterium]|nr:carboxypeptidase-like regulatory domain-containing protein [Bacteroidaceae bacterium]
MVKKRLFSAAALAAASSLSVWAQRVEGTIVDATTGESIIGATVKYADGKGVTTDFDGHFAIDVKSLPVKLNISFTGYRAQTVTVYDDEEDISVKLTEKRNYLNDVVVVGYGTQSRTQLTGSVVTVKSDVFENSTASTLDGALSGQVAGL